MNHEQFTLPFLDTTTVAEGFGLYGGFPTAKSSAYAQINVEPEEAELLDAPVPTKPSLPAQDYRLAGERRLADGWKARAEDNLAAIRLMTTIEAEGRGARPEEQERLARFTAFGASDLADRIFRRAGDPFAPAWEDLGVELEGLVSRDDLAKLKRATQYAHYTPEFMIRAIWRTLRRMGFDGGCVLEPGCGTGLFFALCPEALVGKLAMTGVEMDPTTARIAKLLYPNARIRHEDFTKARLPELYDLAIGNPPFSDRTVRADDPAGELRLSLHDYFIARSVERLRPGGLAAFVTSRWTMDKVDGKARQHIAAMADLIGAVRMAEGAMHDRAGTEVVVDILFLQKRGAGTAPAGAAWDVLAEAVPAEDGETALSINRYFIEHPEMALGTHARTSSAYGPAYTLKPVLSTPGALSDLLAQALDRLPRDLFKPTVKETKPSFPSTVHVGTAAEGATIKEGSYLIHEGALVQIIGGEPQAVAVRDGKGTEGIPAKHARIIRSLIAVRDALREVLRTQANDEPWGSAQIRLRSAYALFVRNFGPINLTTISETMTAEGETSETFRRPNLQPFLDDPDVWLVASIEDYDLESGTAKHGPIFRERVLHPETTPVIETAEDALAVALHETGLVDLDRIAELLGRSRETAIAELGERIFLDPEATAAMNRDLWVTADAYLSGKIRDKLTAAQAAAGLDPRYQRNVAALEKILPEDLKPSDITARLGAPWIPADVVASFAEEVLGVKTPVYHTVEIASWSINVHAFAGLASSSTDWGTSRRHAGELLMDALNASLPQIYDEFEEDGVKKRVLNAADTEAAKDKLMKIKAAFETWVWKDVERADRLARIYNDRFNNLVPRHFDGSHLTIPGASSVINFYAHQKRAIWRIVASGTTYVAHAVGAGKTFSLAAAIMEQKRLGLITKAMMVVPGHCLAQASREFLQLYPTARILVADETNFVKDKRQRFLARAATAQWDCIIITHSAFKFIPAPAEFERRLIADQIQSYSDLLERVDGADRLSRKRIERMKEGLEEDLDRLKSNKDDMLTIAEIGVDQLIVDEMQEFRKLSFATNQTTLKGIDPEGSQRAWDLYVKARFIDSTKNPGRALVAASGTPITNSLAELFTVQRFVQPDALMERGIQQFDAWAANFGETRTELELQPSGLYKPVTRFCEFVNVPDLMAIYRMATDVVLKSDLRQYLKLPAIVGGRRQIVAAPASEAFLGYQRHLAERIKAIEQRQRKPQKGDDILLSVITDGRHAAIDLRFVRSGGGAEPENKLNALIDNVHRISEQTANDRFTRLDGVPYALPGAAQMIFSDLGTLAAEEARGFSAYRWIKDSLVARGVPSAQIAFMQDYKKSSAKQRLFNAVNGGQVRILIGSSETMGTGVNAQRRLKALHHLDVPWLPSQIEQREGRIERQGNENDEIELYAYATKRSVDATGWQILERKARFIDAAMSGDRSVRRIEDAGSQANQFALAKAIASGDERLMRKAGIASEIGRLARLRDSHFDDQFAIRRKIGFGEKRLEDATRRIEALTTGVDTPTTGFSGGHGATALSAGSVFNAGPASNPPLGVSNTLNIGDDLETRGSAIGATTLNYTAVSGGPFAVNPPLVTDLVMNGVNAAVITNVSGAVAGFSGNITGLTSATLALTSTNNVRLGVAGNGLNTALTDVTVNASHNFTAFMTPAALAAAPSGTVHLLGNGVTTDVALNVTGGTTGYAQLTVDSGGTGANNLTLDIGTATNTATVVATGAEFLTLQGTALDIANLHTFTGTADTGGVSVTFNVASTGAGNVAATGGSGDDTFRFLDTGTGFASFLSTSSVDGGTGTNTLVIQADTGAIFDIIGPPGFVPGSNIVNIQTVVHETDGVAATNLTADLVALGSATTFDLAGNYNLHNVSVTDITNAQTVEYSGTGLNHLTLLHAAPGLGDIINFTMDQTLAGGTLDLTQLRVAAQVPALDQIDLNSTGNAALNQIDDVHLVDANILVTGATSLQLGDNPGDAYDLRNGTIDAQQMTGGGTSAWLAPTAGSAANFMTFIAGPTGTTNVVNLATAGGAVIDFTHSGNDTVEFHATAVGGNPLADTAHNYNNVLASTTVAPSININVGDIPTFNTNGGAVVADDATHALSFTTGTTVDGRLNADNFINITTPITSSGVETAQTGFAAAIGGGLGDGIEVTGPAHNFLLSYYDNTTGNAVLLTATSHPFLLVEEVNATSTIHVVGLIHESAAQYASIASQVHFV